MSKNCVFCFLVFVVCFKVEAQNLSAGERAYEKMVIEKGYSAELPTEFQRDIEADTLEAMRQGALVRWAKGTLVLANNQYLLNNFSLYESGLQKIIKKLNKENLEHKRYIGHAYNFLAYYYDERSYLSAAAQAYREAVSLYKSCKDSVEIVVNNTALIKILSLQGEFAEAQEVIDSTTAVLNQLYNPPCYLQAGLNNNKGFYYNEQSQEYFDGLRFKKSDEDKLKIISIFKKNLPLAEECEPMMYPTALLNVAYNAASLNQFDTANYYLKILFTKFKNTNTSLLIYGYSTRAFAEAKQGKYETALSTLDSAFSMLGLPQEKNALTIPLNDNTDAFLRLGPLVLNLSLIKVWCWQGIVKQNKREEDWKTCLDMHEKSVRIFEYFQKSLFDESSLIANRSSFQKIYLEASETAASKFRLTTSNTYIRDSLWNKAFMYAEKGQSFALRQNIQDVDKSDSKPGEARDSLQRRDWALRDTLFKFRAEGKSLIEKLQERARFIDSLKNCAEGSEGRRYYDARYSFQPVAPEILQKELVKDEQTLFLEYVWAAPHPFALWATKAEKGIVFLEINEQNSDMVWDDVIKFQTKWLQEEGEQDTLVGRRLYDLILGKVLADVPTRKKVRKIVVVADNLLRTLPFDILLAPRQDTRSADIADVLSYALYNYDFSYQYSATTWYLQQRRLDLLNAKNKSPKIGAFINPKGKCSQFPLNNLGVFFAKSMPKLYPKHIKCFLNRDVKNFKKQQGNFDILTFCMHGCLEKQAEKSYLAFGDDALSILDVYGLKMGASLAIFASCVTARETSPYADGGTSTGRQGEAVIGLHRAFAYAGCPNVIATLNNVYDLPSQKLLELFYHYLFTQKLPTDKALAEAKKHYLKTEKRYILHPRYWANFVSIGPSAQFR